MWSFEEVFVLNVWKSSVRMTAALAVAFALSLMATPAQAADKGKITGKVIGKDGNGVAGAQVRLTNPPAKKDGKPAPAAADEKPAKGEKGANLVAKTQSEADGSFTLADVTPGDYVLVARTKDKLQAREKITVKAGETATVELKVKEPKPKK
jgi:hypothetical protein